MAPGWWLGLGHTACKPSLGFKSPLTFLAVFSFLLCSWTSGCLQCSRGKAETSVVRAEECDCPKSPPFSPIEDSMAICLSQQPPLPGSFSGTCDQHVSDLFRAYSDHTVARGLPGWGTLCLSGPLFPHLYKEGVGPTQRSQWRQTWLSQSHHQVGSWGLQKGMDRWLQ